MSHDTTSCGIIIFDCPPEHVGSVIDLLNNQILTDFGEPSTTLLLVNDYLYGTVDAGCLHEVTDSLVEMGVHFCASEDPVAEYEGLIYINLPELGLFEGTCDINGNVAIPAYSLQPTIDEATDLETLKETLNRRLGRAWVEALQPLLKRTPYELSRTTPEKETSG